METHSPKVAALLAYDGELLSAAARRRVERHLAGCETCRRTLAAIRAYDQLAEAQRETAAPALDWNRLQPRIAAEAARQARSRRVRRRARSGAALGGLGVAAAAALAMAWVQRSPQPEPPAELPGPPQVVTADPDPINGQVMALAGEVRWAPAGPADASALRPLEVGTELAEGAELQCGKEAEAHVRLREGTGFVLGPESNLGLRRLRADAVRLDLERGWIASTVASSTPAQTYVVRAGAWRARVRGTAFTVQRDGARVRVTVKEGIVEVRRGGNVATVIRAPGHWTNRDSSASQKISIDTKRPRGLEPGAMDWPVLELPKAQAVARWKLGQGDAAFDAPGVLATRVPEGEVPVHAFGADGREARITVHVTGESVTLGEARLKSLAARLTRPQQGELPAEAIRRVVQQAQPAFQRCHERLLKRRPDRAARYALRLRVTVGRSGVVRKMKVRTQGAHTPPEMLVTCIRTEMKRHAFPEPEGGPVTFEVPLNFQPREVD